jgi:hypothetical protein
VRFIRRDCSYLSSNRRRFIKIESVGADVDPARRSFATLGGNLC